MSSFAPSQWRDFFVATSGAGAALGAVILGLISVFLVRGVRLRAGATRNQVIQRIIAAELPPLALVIGGVSTALGLGLGLHRLIVAILLAFVAGVVDAWVLRVEILR